MRQPSESFGEWPPEPPTETPVTSNQGPHVLRHARTLPATPACKAGSGPHWCLGSWCHFGPICVRWAAATRPVVLTGLRFLPFPPRRWVSTCPHQAVRPLLVMMTTDKEFLRREKSRIGCCALPPGRKRPQTEPAQSEMKQPIELRAKRPECHQRVPQL